MKEHYYILQVFTRKKWRDTIGKFETIEDSTNEYFRRKELNKGFDGIDGKFPQHRIKEIYHAETFYNI